MISSSNCSVVKCLLKETFQCIFLTRIRVVPEAEYSELTFLLLFFLQLHFTYRDEKYVIYDLLPVTAQSSVPAPFFFLI